MLTKEDYKAADKLIEGAVELIMKDIDRVIRKLGDVLGEIEKDYENDKLKIFGKQWQDIIVLVGGIANHDVQQIETEIENLYVHGEVRGKLLELVGLARKFETLNFGE